MGHGQLVQLGRRRIAWIAASAVDLGCNFFDTAYAYGDGRSENLLGQIVRSNPRKAALHRDQDSAEESSMARAA